MLTDLLGAPTAFRALATGHWHLTPGYWHLAPGTWHLKQAPDTRHLTPDTHLTPGTWDPIYLLVVTGCGRRLDVASM